MGWVFTAARALFPSCGGWRLLLTAACRLPVAVAFLLWKRGLSAWAQQVQSGALEHGGSVVVAHNASCSRRMGSSGTRDQTPMSPCTGRQTLNHQTTRESPPSHFQIPFFLSQNFSIPELPTYKMSIFLDKVFMRVILSYSPQFSDFFFNSGLFI